MPPFLADENFNHRILRGLVRREPGLDVVTVLDVGLGQTPDPDILEWAAANGRVVLTHDIQTLVPNAYARVAAGMPMPGVIAAPDGVAIGQAIDDILLLATAGQPGDLDGQVIFLPM